MLIYLAGPLSNEAERAFNLRVRAFVQAMGFDTYLPQEDGGLFSELIKHNVNEDQVRKQLYHIDIDALRRSDAVLAILDGRVPDEGMCFELGYAVALGRPCLGFKTDSRSALRGHDNLMLECSLRSICRSWAALKCELDQLLEPE